MEPRGWRKMTGKQSLVQRSVWTNNGVEELSSKIKTGVAIPAEELCHIKSSSRIRQRDL